MKQRNLVAFVAIALAGVSAIVPELALAVPPALDVTDATEYLDTTAGTGMAAVAVVVFGLAGLALAIKWVKATFFG